MTKDNVIKVLDALEQIYPEAKAELRFSNPFETLIATILSAQCTDKRVNKVTETLFAECPDVRAFAKLTQAELEDKIRTCGLYRTKARNILTACRALVEEHDGRVPDTREALMRLPGVGRKTAGVVLMAAFGGDQIPVDTHVFRVANRIGLACADTPEKTEDMLLDAIPPGRRSHAHHMLIWHGRRVCNARAPQCDKCPLAERLCEHAQAKANSN